MAELLACVHVCEHVVTDTYVSVHVSHLVNAQPKLQELGKTENIRFCDE